MLKPHIQFIGGYWVISPVKGIYVNGYACGHTIEETWGYWLKLVERMASQVEYMSRMQMHYLSKEISGEGNQ